MISGDIGRTAKSALGLIGVVSFLICTSCAPKVSDVQAEVDHLAPAGKALKTATVQMKQSDFGCSGVNPTQCSRSTRSCVEQVLILSDKNNLVTQSHVEGVHCLYTL